MPYINRPYQPTSRFFSDYLHTSYIDPPLTTIPDRAQSIDLALWPSEVLPSGQVKFHSSASLPQSGGIVRKEEERMNRKEKVFKPDLVLFATGYRTDWSWVGEEYRPVGEERVRDICEREDVSAGWIGFVRPGVGAIPPIAEQQAMLWALLLLERVPIPTSKPHYKLLASKGARIQHGVDYSAYMATLANDMGAAPSIRQLWSDYGIKVLIGYWSVESLYFEGLHIDVLFTSFGASFVPYYRLVGPFRAPEMEEIVTGELFETITRRGLLGNLFMGLVPRQSWLFPYAMSRVPPIQFGQSSTPLPTLPYVSLLPASIAHDGPANISTYFPTRPLSTSASPSSSTDTPTALEAAFRGRLVVSTPFTVPEGYTGLIFSTSTPAPSRAPVASTSTPSRAVKKPKTVKEVNGEEVKGKQLMSAPSGVRRSPRKSRQVVVQAKFSMDSDEDDEEEGEGEPSVEPSEVAVQDSSEPKTVEEGPEPPSSPAPPVGRPLIAESSSSMLLLSETPATPQSEADSQPVVELKRDVEAAGFDEQDDEELARDVQILVPQATFDTIQIWHADFALDVEVISRLGRKRRTSSPIADLLVTHPQEDTYARTLTEWFSVADKVSLFSLVEQGPPPFTQTLFP
ncbi:hypothetical protein P7C70_g7195, partial [Phenoliferia sp. Uapishka_3]